VKKPLIALVLILSAGISTAATINCSGYITNAYVNANGDFVVRSSWREDYTTLRNTNSDPVNCSLWVSLVNSSIVADKNVKVRYRDIASCASIATYNSAPDPSYVMLVR
jgi:hypothetical protein